MNAKTLEALELALHYLDAAKREADWYDAERFVAETRQALASSTARSPVEGLRKAGWSVAVHNDYRLHGRPHTFWLFTHPDGRWIKGEGETDEAAIQQAASLAALTAIHPQAEGETGCKALKPGYVAIDLATAGRIVGTLEEGLRLAAILRTESVYLSAPTAREYLAHIRGLAEANWALPAPPHPEPGEL